MKSRKKIVRLFSRLNVGGPSIHVINLAAGLNPFGYDTILVVGSPDETEGNLGSLAESAKVDTVVIPSFQAAISPHKDLIALIQIVRLLRKERPEIVHTHTFKAGLLGRIAAWLTGVPVVVHTYHGHLLTGYGSNLKANVISFVEFLLAKITHRIIAVSRQVADDLVHSGIAKRDKIEAIELGFDIEKIKSDLAQPATLRRDCGIPDSAFVVGIIGRLVPVKAIDIFLNALCPLLSEFPQLHMAIIGDGVVRIELERLADQLANQLTVDRSRVHFTGWRLPATRDLSDLDLCVCSSKNEGTSVSVIEAAIAGVPIISTRVGGMADLLENGRWGQLVEFGVDELQQGVRDHISAITCENSQTSIGIIRARSKEASDHFQKRFAVERLLTDVANSYGRARGTSDAHL